MSPDLLRIILIILAVFVAVTVGTIVLVVKLRKREPYRTFIELPNRRKLSFLKAVVTDKRVPWYAKALVPATVLYLLMPFDIIPDFIPVLGEMDDVAVVLIALALFIKLCPGDVVQEHLRQAVTP